MRSGIEVNFYKVLSARLGAGYCLLFYFMGNCSEIVGHRNEFLYGAATEWTMKTNFDEKQYVEL